MAVARTLQDHFSKHITPLVFKLNQLFRPARRRPVAFFKQGLRFRVHSESWDTPQRERWVMERLRYVVRHAARTTSHYAALFREIGFDPKTDFDFDAFSAIPPLE